MLPQETAVEKIRASLQSDPLVKAIFLKGSMGRNEHDEHSDIDLYCLVAPENVEAFLPKRLAHLEAYQNIIFQDDIFIIAPQLIAVFENLLHIDLFTVTLESFTEKDYFRVLYDPEDLLQPFKETQNLQISEAEFQDSGLDVAWFLFQYKKAAARGNDIWAAKMLTYVTDHFARVLLYRYAPERAQLGMKTLARSLPEPLLNKFREIADNTTPCSHRTAAALISRFLEDEVEWISSHLDKDNQTEMLLRKMIALHSANHATK